MYAKQPGLLLKEILDSADKILRYTEGLTFERFMADARTVDAVVWNFEVIDNASNRLPSHFKHEHFTIDWFKIHGFHECAIRDYFDVDYQSIWTLKDSHLKNLVIKIQNILSQEDI